MACSGLRPSDGDGLVTHSAMSHRLWCRSRAWESGAALRSPGCRGQAAAGSASESGRQPGGCRAGFSDCGLPAVGRLQQPSAPGRPSRPPTECPRAAPSSRAGQAQVTGTLFFMSGVGLRYFISKESLSGGTCFHIREGLHPQRRSMAGSAAVLV